MKRKETHYFSSLVTTLFLQESSLVTISKNDRVRIENIDSLLVGPIQDFLKWFDFTSKKFDIIPFFRGFKPDFRFQDQLKRNTAKFFEFFFVVGEKGNAYREDIAIDGIEPYFNRSATVEDLKELLVIANKAQSKGSHKLLNLEDFQIMSKDDIQNTYIFLLNFVHNIGGRWKDKIRSPFVSAAYGEDGFDTALKFASSRNDSEFSYVIWGFIPESRKHNTILTKELTKDIRRLNADWYEDIHSEIIIKDGIFPSNILGVFEILRETDRKKFIINPYLYQLFDVEKGDSSEHIDEIFQYVCINGIPVDQKHFSEFAKQLGYISRGLDKHDGKIRARRIGTSADIILPREYRFSIKEVPND